MRYTIMTPTLQRKSLIRACESVNFQTCTDWEHIVIYDGDFRDRDMFENIKHPNRIVLPCMVPNGYAHSYGHPCKHYAYPIAKGDYLFNLDDDNFFVHAEALQDLKQVTGQWAIFPMLRFGGRFFNDPPGPSLTASENFMVRREIGRWLNTDQYAADAFLIEQLKAKYPYQAFPDMRPAVSVEVQQMGKLND